MAYDNGHSWEWPVPGSRNCPPGGPDTPLKRKLSPVVLTTQPFVMIEFMQRQMHLMTSRTEKRRLMYRFEEAGFVEGRFRF